MNRRRASNAAFAAFVATITLTTPTVLALMTGLGGWWVLAWFPVGYLTAMGTVCAISKGLAIATGTTGGHCARIDLSEEAA